MNTSHEGNKTECESDKMSLSLKRNPQRKETVKGITTQMLVMIGAIIVGVIVLMVIIAFANEESGPGGLAMTVGKGICGFLATSMGGFGAAICNI